MFLDLSLNNFGLARRTEESEVNCTHGEFFVVLKSTSADIERISCIELILCSEL